MRNSVDTERAFKLYGVVFHEINIQTSSALAGDNYNNEEQRCLLTLEDLRNRSCLEPVTARIGGIRLSERLPARDYKSVE